MDITPNVETTRAANHKSEGLHIHFPQFKHDHPAVIDVNKAHDEQLTVGQKVADIVAANMGSWRFIIIQSIILALWILLNIFQLLFKAFDPYPFILLNLALSFQAAFAAPFIMISQNRQAEKDRLTAQNDYITDCKGEEEIRHIMDHLDHQDTLILQIVQRLETQGERLAQQEKVTLEIVQHLEEQNQRLESQHQQMLGYLSQIEPKVAQSIKDSLEETKGE
ncbi:MAG TPA: DUF1003 domain-containing protein [Ktedonobacteraceae bacterium]|nr:DUF1003 domain-containing protein [Ktedonobacteraceae bacterium]